MCESFQRELLLCFSLSLAEFLLSLFSNYFNSSFKIIVKSYGSSQPLILLSINPTVVVYQEEIFHFSKFSSLSCISPSYLMNYSFSLSSPQWLNLTHPYSPIINSNNFNLIRYLNQILILDSNLVIKHSKSNGQDLSRASKLKNLSISLSSPQNGAHNDQFCGWLG